MKKIAIIIDGNLIDRKGQVIASLNRITRLKAIANYQIDVYAIQNYEGTLVRLLRRTKERERLSSITVDGIEIKLLWNRSHLINYLLVYKFNSRPLFRNRWNRQHVRFFKNYDLVSANSIACGRLALAIHEQYGIPFYVTWHGSDIHTLPYINKYNKIDTVNVLEKATGNFFVSKTLMKEANKLSKKAPKYVLYNGVGSQFYRYTDERRAQLREEFKVHNQKVVAFIGNLFPIKNVLLLPNIFKKVSEIYKGEVVFWIVGDGKLRAPLASLLQENNVKCVLWGNQPVDRMPDFMNAIDVLVLPSKNEGLPLVTVEALACGANVVGSNVGGIAEVIDNDNVFELDAEFETNISNRIVEMLRTPIQQSLSSVFNWDATASLENNIYSMELSK